MELVNNLQSAPEPQPNPKVPSPTPFSCAYRAFFVDEKIMATPEQLEAQGVFVTSTGKIIAISKYEGFTLPKIIPLFYSGCRDKTNKAIFEGDICKMGVRLYPDLPSVVEKYGIMRWIRDRFILHIVGTSPNTPLEVVEVEIMGNEYENPELVDKVQ